MSRRKNKIIYRLASLINDALCPSVTAHLHRGLASPPFPLDLLDISLFIYAIPDECQKMWNIWFCESWALARVDVTQYFIKMCCQAILNWKCQNILNIQWTFCIFMHFKVYDEQWGTKKCFFDRGLSFAIFKSLQSILNLYKCNHLRMNPCWQWNFPVNLSVRRLVCKL